ncbi:uncharacterized protein [Venturia canescens]|uniref:uncharacterized protein n=1 Tax=Venturia canescens TaxID=32260 RepID=UPI001C9C0597|nr:uncharacterized protein LOC122406259 [Venturia canescens]
MNSKTFIVFLILPWISIIGDPTEASEWASVLDESLDERHDAEIFRAVVESMRQWENHKKNSHRMKRATSRVCYEEVGCFEDTGPFSYLEMLPSPPKDVGTRFFMYGSRKARSVPMEVPADDINDKVNNAIDPDLPTKVIVHGFGSGCEHVWVYEMRSALMSVHDCNIVCVDWSLGSAIPNYVRAAANTRLVGRQLAKLVRSLNVPLEKVHLIGFSLGAHVAGFAGAELANVSRITGLDPAGPLFESQDPRARLDETDANYVDVIHSNGEQLILGGLGSWQPMGDVDFYPNGGRMQTGCSNLFVGAVSDIIWSGSIEGRSLCNHRRAYKLFTDSVSPKCRFPAFPCESGYDGLLKGDCFPCGVNGDERSCGDMGYYSDATGARGQLYLVTREEEPFCAYQYQVKVYNSRGERPARSYGKLQVTLVGQNNFNETFTMTRKDDEELLVGSILQKIVVPHPAVADLGAIEIKYTAYSGWISSGLVSWSVDKVSVLDSFGKSLSVCMRGLPLESGRAVFLPLYPGECNNPMDLDNSTSSHSNATKLAAMRMEPMEKKSDEVKPAGGIGPFTREQNYEMKDLYPGDAVSENKRPQKGLGPFTKDQNTSPAMKEESVQIAFVPKDGENSPSITDSKKSIASPWSYVDVSDAGSNSLENTEIENGRAFSGSNFVPSSTPETASRTTVSLNYTSEAREVSSQVAKKETGRSMRLPEIIEPILRARATRQNLKNDDHSQGETSNEDPEDASRSNSTQAIRAFTVQFLPERIVGILAQAEKYARQTLLPLISQYTPSFGGSARQERVKYFPPLTDLEENTTSDSPVPDNVASPENTVKNNEVDNSEGRGVANDRQVTSGSSRTGKEMERLQALRASGENIRAALPGEIRKSETSELISTSEKSALPRQRESLNSEQSDWIPIERESDKSQRNSSRSLNNENYASRWMSEGAVVWNPPIEDTEAGPDTKIDDWVPITDKTRNKSDSGDSKATLSDRQNSMEAREAGMSSRSGWNVASTSPQSPIPLTANSEFGVDASARKYGESSSSISNVNSSMMDKPEERKYIPLVDFADRDTFLAPKDTNEQSTSQRTTETTSITSHIQKIPVATEKPRDNPLNKRAILFPYAYERNKDPRTRYIPLIPEEEMGMFNPLTERDR